MFDIVAFLKRWWAVLASVLGVIGAAVIGFMAWGVYNKRAITLGDNIKVENAKQRIAELRGRRSVLAEQDEIDESEVSRIDEELEANRQAIVEIRSRASVADNELEREFARLGF